MGLLIPLSLFIAYQDEEKKTWQSSSTSIVTLDVMHVVTSSRLTLQFTLFGALINGVGCSKNENQLPGLPRRWIQSLGHSIMISLLILLVRVAANESFFFLFANAPINVKPVGEKGGGGGDFDIFQKNAVKFPTPGQKCKVKYNWNSPPREMICSHGHKKFQISLPPGQQDYSTALPPGQSDRSERSKRPLLAG